jgi:hypothetical protein
VAPASKRKSARTCVAWTGPSSTWCKKEPRLRFCNASLQMLSLRAYASGEVNEASVVGGIDVGNRYLLLFHLT